MKGIYVFILWMKDVKKKKIQDQEAARKKFTGCENIYVFFKFFVNHFLINYIKKIVSLNNILNIMLSVFINFYLILHTHTNILGETSWRVHGI